MRQMLAQIAIYHLLSSSSDSELWSLLIHHGWHDVLWCVDHFDNAVLELGLLVGGEVGTRVVLSDGLLGAHLHHHLHHAGLHLQLHLLHWVHFGELSTFIYF